MSKGGTEDKERHRISCEQREGKKHAKKEVKVANKGP